MFQRSRDSVLGSHLDCAFETSNDKSTSQVRMSCRKSPTFCQSKLKPDPKSQTRLITLVRSVVET